MALCLPGLSGRWEGRWALGSRRCAGGAAWLVLAHRLCTSASRASVPFLEKAARASFLPLFYRWGSQDQEVFWSLPQRTLPLLSAPLALLPSARSRAAERSLGPGGCA